MHRNLLDDRVRKQIKMAHKICQTGEVNVLKVVIKWFKTMES